MIIDMILGDVLETPYNHIAFKVNPDGWNSSSSAAGQISWRYGLGLEYTGEKSLGEVMSYQAGEKTLHALVCHSCDNSRESFKDMPKTVTKCLDSLDVPENEIIAVVLMTPGSWEGEVSGANYIEILGGIARSKKKVVVYSRIPDSYVIKLGSDEIQRLLNTE